MPKPKLSVDQICDGLVIQCSKCKRSIKKERHVYFTMMDVNEVMSYYCYYCIEPFLELHSEYK